MKNTDAQALLQSTQRLRTHWSGVITTHIGYAIVMNVAIWSYFLKAYIDSLSSQSGAQPIYIGLASAISSVLLGLWRLYTRYVDNHIAGLYPDFLFYEDVLSVPVEYGTSGYLLRAVPRTRLILSEGNLSREQRLAGIRRLVESRRIGRRGHLRFDLSVFIMILLMAGLSFYVFQNELRHIEVIVCFVGIGIGLMLTLIEFFCYQREPKEALLRSIRSEVTSPNE